ncbi:hypothetical protein CF326_g7880 [Tilletia indica]|nr:hypothetical protein CF326_g7880 [Tilletia indica]
MSSLLDTGASLSIIDRNLLHALGGTVTGQTMPVSGLGSAMSYEWCTIPVLIDGRDERGNAIGVECILDVNVLEASAPGLCLGQDFISTHGVTIQARRGITALEVKNRILTFAVHDRLPAPYAKQAELCVLRDVVVPARSHAWVPVDYVYMNERLLSFDTAVNKDAPRPSEHHSGN